MSCFILLSACAHQPKTQNISQTIQQTKLGLKSLYAEHVDMHDQLNPQWIDCLAPFFSSRPLGSYTQQNQQKFSDDLIYCSSLLSRPNTETRPKFLNRDWLIIKAQEYIRPSLDIQSQQQRQMGPLKHALNQGDWSLKVTILRLPPYQDQAEGVEKNRPSSLAKFQVPAPLKRWANAKVNQAVLSEWNLDTVQTRPISIASEMTFKQLPTPRVGQVLHLDLSQKAPTILRGAWALHHHLWLNAPTLYKEFVFNAPRAIQLSYFGQPAQQHRKESYGQVLTWQNQFLASGEGGDLYISTMDSWSKIHNWLWQRFHDAFLQYERVLNKRLNSSLFNYFLFPRTPRATHRWIRQNFKYQAQSKTPYEPMPIGQFLRSKEGDCKEFTTLAQALLKLQGQQTFLAFTSSKPIPKYALNTPSIGWFDHVLLWQPSPDALRLATLSAKSRQIISLGLTEHHWFDPTSSRIGAAPTGLAYVMLGPQTGFWTFIQD